MLSLDVIDLILPNLSPHQIDGLELQNRELSEFIRANRARYPGHPMKLVHLTAGTEPDSCTAYVETNECFLVPPRAGKISDMCRDLCHLEPKKLSISRNVDTKFLAKLWLKKIDKIYVEGFASKEEFEIFVGKLCCSTVFFKTLPREVDANMIIENMKHARKISLPSVRCTPSFFQSIVEKSKEGPGLKLFELKNEVNNPVDAESLLHFFTNCQFDKCRAAIEFVKGSKKVFDEGIKRMDDRYDRYVVFRSETIYEMVGYRCTIELVIKNFLDTF